MSSPSAEATAAGLVAIVGAETTLGARLREVLAAAQVPPARVQLFTAAPAGQPGEAHLSEYAGQARLIREASAEALAGHAVVFACARTPQASRLAMALSDRTLWLDLAPGLEGAPPELAPLNVDLEALRSGPRRLRVPHVWSLVLRDVLAPLEDAFGVEEAAGTLLRPAADFGAEAIEELREQTVRLFRFEPHPTAVFGRPLSFNVLPETLLDLEAATPSRVAEEVRALLGWAKPRLAVTSLVVPVFHGHAAALHVRLRRPAGTAEVAALFRERGLERPEGRTPLEAAEGESGLHADVGPSATGGLWLWAVRGEGEPARLRLAWELARAWMGGR